MKTALVAAIALTSAALVAQPAQARGHSDAGVFIAGAIAAVAIGAALAQPTVTYAAPAPVYAPQGGYVQSGYQSGYYRAPAVVYAPAPRVYVPAPVVRYEPYRYGGGYGHEHGHDRGHDYGRHVGWDRR